MLIVKVKSSWCWVSGRGRRGWRWMSWKVNDWRTISYWSTHTICWQYSKLMRDVPVSWLSLLITNRHVLVRWCQDWGFCSPPSSPELTTSLDWYSVLEGSDGTIVYSYNPVLQILVNKQYWSYEKIWPTHTWLLTAQCTLITRTPQIEPIEAHRVCLLYCYGWIFSVDRNRKSEMKPLSDARDSSGAKKCLAAVQIWWSSCADLPLAISRPESNKFRLSEQ